MNPGYGIFRKYNIAEGSLPTLNSGLLIINACPLKTPNGHGFEIYYSFFSLPTLHQTRFQKFQVSTIRNYIIPNKYQRFYDNYEIIFPIKQTEGHICLSVFKIGFSVIT